MLKVLVRVGVKVGVNVRVYAYTYGTQLASTCDGRLGAVAHYAPLTGHTRAHSRLAWLLRGLTGFDYRGVPCKNGNHVNMR